MGKTKTIEDYEKLWDTAKVTKLEFPENNKGRSESDSDDYPSMEDYNIDNLVVNTHSKKEEENNNNNNDDVELKEIHAPANRAITTEADLMVFNNYERMRALLIDYSRYKPGKGNLSAKASRFFSGKNTSHGNEVCEVLRDFDNNKDSAKWDSSYAETPNNLIKKLAEKIEAIDNKNGDFAKIIEVTEDKAKIVDVQKYENQVNTNNFKKRK